MKRTKSCFGLQEHFFSPDNLAAAQQTLYWVIWLSFNIKKSLFAEFTEPLSEDREVFPPDVSVKCVSEGLVTVWKYITGTWTAPCWTFLHNNSG